MQKQKIQISILANLNYSALVRHVADEIFAIAKFNKAWCSRLKLVVDELFMNAVRYGSTKDKSLVYITFSYDENEVQFTIEDDGTGSHAISVEELENIIHKNEEDSDLTRTSGRGLSMITKLWTDQMEITKSNYGGIAITFTKRIEEAAPPPPLPPKLIKKAPPVPAKPKEVPIKAPAKAKAKGPAYEIKLSGEIDPSNIEAQMAPIYDQVEVMPEGGTLILDFSELDYVNSTFIGNLAALYKALQKKQGHIRLKNINEQIKEVLDLVGLLSVLEVET